MTPADRQKLRELCTRDPSACEHWNGKDTCAAIGIGLCDACIAAHIPVLLDEVERLELIVERVAEMGANHDIATSGADIREFLALMDEGADPRVCLPGKCAQPSGHLDYCDHVTPHRGPDWQGPKRKP